MYFKTLGSSSNDVSYSSEKYSNTFAKKINPYRHPKKIPTVVINTVKTAIPLI